MIRYKPVPKASFDKLEGLSEFFEPLDEVEMAYLFGGAASGRVGPLSDIDIACLLRDSGTEDKTKRLDEELRLQGLLTSYLGTDELDLVILNRCPISVAYQVVRTGKIVFCRDESVRMRFFERAVLRYLDFAPVLGICFQYIKGTGRIGRGGHG